MMHDRIMTRSYKFLVVNVLVFFCVGTAALQSFLTLRTAVSGSGIINTVANSFRWLDLSTLDGVRIAPRIVSQ
jgi:hypothetical protein